MNLSELLDLVQIDLQLPSLPAWAIFLIALLLSIIIGRYTPGIVRFFIYRFTPQHQGEKVAEGLVDPTIG
ncbi:mechanosensitive ion channel protein MscS, partial [filamentous cyanobacterium CCP5]